MDEVLASVLAKERFNAVLSAAFAVLAALLTAVGIYGVLSYAVSRRTREIGVRMALGARRADVLAHVARRGAVPIAAGLVLGLVGARFVARFLDSLVYEIEVDDPVTFAAAAVLAGTIAALATWLPARRASRQDPGAALRYE